MNDIVIPFATVAMHRNNNGETRENTISGSKEPSITAIDRTVYIQFAVASETFIFFANMGNVGPVMLSGNNILFIGHRIYK